MDIHGNPDLFDSMAQADVNSKKAESQQFIEAAQEYALQGFDEKQVSELLVIDGCSSEVSKDLALASCHNVPSKYADNEKPVTYSDIKASVEQTLLAGKSEDIQRYFDRHSDRRFSKIAARVLVARDTPARIFIEELHAELRPLIEGIMIDNEIISKQDKRASASLSDKERLELDLFGVWPVYLIQKQARKIEAEEEIYDKHVSM